MKRRSTLGWTPLREEDCTMKYDNGYVTISLNFDKEAIKWMRTKYEIKSKEDLVAAVVDCITTTMEL